MDIGKYVTTRFDTLNYEFERSLPRGNNKKVIGIMWEHNERVSFI